VSVEIVDVVVVEVISGGLFQMSQSEQGKSCAVSVDFVLGGKRYSLTHEGVVESLRGQEPHEVRRYYVEVQGRRYPPKQVFELATDLSPVEFTTMDAVRILKKLRFEINRVY